MRWPAYFSDEITSLGKPCFWLSGVTLVFMALPFRFLVLQGIRNNDCWVVSFALGALFLIPTVQRLGLGSCTENTVL